MTLPADGRKLTQNEKKSMESTLKEGDIRAIHPERMEALAEKMVSKLKSVDKGWRTCDPLSD